MARDKLITIRIEGEKREAFNNLAKSQNTDTASLLYDFISGCLGGKIDISLVTGKGNRLDKIDNQLDTNRLDKLETDTQRIDHWIGALSERVNDWILRSDRRLTDCDRELSEKMISLEHRLNALAIQLDSQQDRQEIDTDSQRIDDMEPLLKRERESSIAAPLPTGEPSHDEPDQPAIETVTPEVSPSPPSPPDAIESLPTVESVEPISTIEPGTDAIETVPGDSDSIGEPCKGMNAAEAFRYVTKKGVKVSEKTLSNWVKLKQIPVTDKGDKVSEYLILRDGLYFPNPD